ncbi:MAG: SusD/RagB family nutrient-binding outer membrane lipoprotein, partial [Flavisolibacter sp.]
MQYKIKTLFIAAFMATLLPGCKKDFFDINQNPNDLTANSITSDLIVPAALHNVGALDAAGNSVGYDWLNKWMGYWSNSGSFAPTQEESTYNITTGFLALRWTGTYNWLNDFYIVEQKATAEGNLFYAGIAKVMKARGFQDLVDTYGDLPYSEAFQLKEFPTPKYDNAQ